MKIPNSNVTCQFYYQRYRTDTVRISKTITYDDTTLYCPINIRLHAKSIEEVPYWSLYIVKRKLIQKYPFVRYTNKYVCKSTFNHTFDELCNLLRDLGNANDLYRKEKDTTYFYAAWPRKTRCNNCKTL